MKLLFSAGPSLHDSRTVGFDATSSDSTTPIDVDESSTYGENENKYMDVLSSSNQETSTNVFNDISMDAPSPGPHSATLVVDKEEISMEHSIPSNHAGNTGINSMLLFHHVVVIHLTLFIKMTFQRLRRLLAVKIYLFVAGNKPNMVLFYCIIRDS